VLLHEFSEIHKFRLCNRLSGSEKNCIVYNVFCIFFIIDNIPSFVVLLTVFIPAHKFYFLSILLLIPEGKEGAERSEQRLSGA